ncbi:MAG: single-stranded-DNA-specific exonuclease RecJ [Phycisphaerae bacterium]|jgi:single-stranded-DNA-specific exonuclease
MTLRAWKCDLSRWQVAPAHPGAAELARGIGTAPLVAQILCNRNITDIPAGKAFLNPRLTDLHGPELLPGCVQAARLVAAAVAAKKRIVIYGDYDVDGMTAVAILDSVLAMVGADVHFYVPHRLEEGYGVNDEAVAKLAGEGAELLITVDCGISALGPLAAAKAAGMTVIVTDHHGAGSSLPAVDAIVHPSLPGGDYPNGDLAGAGVAFKLAWQIAREICGETRVDEAMRQFLLEATCLAALGTVADVVPLVGENRSLVVHGLRGLRHTKHSGLRALLKSADLDGEKLDAYHVGFLLAPRLNACGRMGHARLAVELLTRATAEKSEQIAQYLAQQNTERQKVERAITAEAVEKVQQQGMDGEDCRVIVLADENWHGGVIGIVASRLVDRFDKPAILISLNGDGGQGSGRSIASFHMREALEACSAHLRNFGGHAMAGGLRIEREKVADFAAAMGEYARMHVSVAQLAPTLRIDAETTLAGLGYNIVEHLDRLAPHGQGNPPPALLIRRCKLVGQPRRMGKGGGVVSLVLSQGGTTMRAVGFGMGELADSLAGVNFIDVVAQPVLNRFNGRCNVELQIKDLAWE